MNAKLEVRDGSTLWLAVENDHSAPVELQAIDVALSHSGKEFEGEVLPYQKSFGAGERTALSLDRFVRMHLQLQRAQAGSSVRVTCRLLAFAEDPADAEAAPASLNMHWNGEAFSVE